MNNKIVAVITLAGALAAGPASSALGHTALFGGSLGTTTHQTAPAAPETAEPKETAEPQEAQEAQEAQETPEPPEPPETPESGD